MITVVVEMNAPLKNLGKTIQDSFGQLSQEARPLVRALGSKYVQIARAEAPKRSGRFAGSIESQEFADSHSFGFQGLSAKPIGHWIILGTKPHKIAPRNKGALYFFWTKIGVYTVVPKAGTTQTHMADGKLWIGKGFVQHPGTQPNPFPQRALAKLKDDIEKLLKTLSDRWIQIIQRGPR